MNNNLEKKISAGMDISLPAELFIGKGLSFYVKGWIYHPLYKIKQIEISINDTSFPMDEINQPRMDILKNLQDKDIFSQNRKHALYSGFSGCIDLQPNLTGTMVNIKVIAYFKNGYTYTIDSVTTYLKKKKELCFPLPIRNDYNPEKPLVAICMATYNPETEAFKKQIRSIIEQSYENWICVISDDNSDPKKRSSIQKTIENDKRFYFIENKKNLGYYYNFERVLYSVPAEAEYVALSDQDDFWYPDKLKRLTEKIKRDKQVKLVYSDMKIVTNNGKIISETYWRKRKNHYQNLGMVMVCGTVTGAATLFRKELLETVLPFTQNTGNAFHDHLISCAALATGKIAYINEPLYEYIQHDSNVIGHHEFKKESIMKLVANDLQKLSRLTHRVVSLYNNYDMNYIRLRLMARSFILRGARPSKSLLLFNNTFLSIIRLFLLHVKVRSTQKTTENAEVVIALSCLIRKIFKYFPAENFFKHVIQ